MTVTKLLDTFVYTIWMLTLAALLVVVVWVSSPSTVDQADQYFRQKYIYFAFPTYLSVVAEYEKSGDAVAHIAALESLISSMSPVQRVDELSSVKRLAYGQLIRVLIREQRLPEAMYWTQQWLAYDPRDINARLGLGKLLLIDPDTRDEGIYELTTLKHRFPDSLAVADGVATAWASIGELGRAFLEYVPHLPGNHHPIKRIIGEVAREVIFNYQPGDKIIPLSEKMEPGESLDVTIETSVDRSELVFENAALEETPTGYRKRPGQHSVLSLLDFDKTKPLHLRLVMKTIAPGTLEILTDPRFRGLILEQLKSLGAVDAIKAYEDYTTST